MITSINEKPLMKTINEYLYYLELYIKNREMLTNALRVLVNNLFKENYYGKRKKKKKSN